MEMSFPLVFFGSGPVAARTLEFLLDNFNVTDVITKPKTQHGHQSLPPVEKLAINKGVQLHTPVSKEELAKLFENNKLPSRVGLVVDYGLMIPQSVIDYFELGIVNSHFSLLPLWRGADPITFPILAGDKETGVSLMLIVAAMDEGPIITQEKMPIADNETTVTLEEKLINLNNILLKEILPKYESGEIEIRQQDSNITPTYSRKLTKEDGQIDWEKSADILEREIRAFIKWPKSYGKISSKDVVVTSASVLREYGQSGKAYRNEDGLAVYCGQGALQINTLKVVGKPEITGKEFISGYWQK